MVASHATLPDLNARNPNELKALIVSQHELIVSRDSEIEQPDCFRGISPKNYVPLLDDTPFLHLASGCRLLWFRGLGSLSC
jgi:hypothetical protein